LILVIVFCSIYGYVTLDVSSHMFGWLEGIKMNTRCPLLTRTAYRPAKYGNFYTLNQCLIRMTTSNS